MSISIEHSVLNRTVSLLRSYRDLDPQDTNLLNFLTDEQHKAQVLAIRAEPDKSKRGELKAALPAIMPSGRFHSRGEHGLTAHSGLLQFDIDNLSPAQIMDVRSRLQQNPYVAYLALSVSGNGLFGIMPISNGAKHKQHFAAMRLYLKDSGVPDIDPTPANVASLRGYSYDPDAYFNHQAQVFTYTYEPPTLRKPYSNSNAIGNEPNVFEDFNQRGNIEALLLKHGWTYQHTKGSRDRYARPGKTSGVSADYCSERKVLYLFSSDPATGLSKSAKGYNHTQVLAELECSGDYKLCRKLLLQTGYGQINN